MVAALAGSPPESHDIHLVTEVRGNVARLWDGAPSEVVLSGAAGTGKTRAILEWIHWRCKQERLSVLILRKTLESLKTSALVTFREQVLYGFDGKRSVRDGVSYFGGNRVLPAQFTYDETGSTITLGGMDNVAKVLSTERDCVFVNEVTELTLDEWELLGGRTDRPRLGPARPPSVLIGDCNPGPPTHWIRQRAETGVLHLWPTTHRDNPAMWDAEVGRWTDAGRRYLKERLMRLTGVRRERFLLGKWVAAEGQVYDAWDDMVHVVENRFALPESFRGWNVWHLGAVDWGWTSPGVIQIWAIDGDRRMALVAEHYHTRKLVDAWWIPQAVRLRDAYGVREWQCDPSQPASIAQFRAAGLNATGAANEILPGIGAVQDRLVPAGDGLPRLFVCRDALLERDESLVAEGLPWSTAQEVGRYVWAKDAGGQSLKDKPVDAYNHGQDCTRYAAARLDLSGGGSLDAAFAQSSDWTATR